MNDVYVLQFILNRHIRLLSYTTTYTEELDRIHYQDLVQDLQHGHLQLAVTFPPTYV